MDVKSFFVLLVFLSIVSISAFADDKIKKNKSETEVKQDQISKEDYDFIKRIDDKLAAMNIQSQYMSKLRKLNYEIEREHRNLKYNDKKRDLQHQEELNELAYRRRVPYSVEKKRDKISDENRYSNENIKKLEMEKVDLELDATKYYKGKLPTEFLKEWNEIETEHIKALHKIKIEP